MYTVSAFSVGDTADIVALARQAGFGHLTVVDADGRPISTPAPFLISDDGSRVRAHLARPNPVWRAAPCRALLIVPVGDTYVSPSWYAAKAEHGKVVPTWNYEVVHAHGELVTHDDPVWLERLVRDLTDLHETGFAVPWSVDDAPPDFIAQMLRGIVGVELIVDELVGKRKLSQNRPESDRPGIVAGLEARDGRGAAAIAAAMHAAGVAGDE